MKHYRYEGAVMSFDRIITERWSDETYAISPKKARSNLCYHFKKQNGLFKTAKIKLVGTVKEIA